jgi:phosphopantothenoylcysteine decarboxylase/phosphopantothenate--cysteine ligase
MGAAVRHHAEGAAVIVMAAAVADFRPTTVVAHKLKKADGVPDVSLEPTADILAGLGADHRSAQTLVGFAAETVAPTSAGTDVESDPVGGHDPVVDHDRLVDYARTKLASKGADLIVANDVAAADVGFGHDTNAVVIVTADGTVTDIDLRSKPDVAIAVVDAVERYRRRASYPNGSAPPGQAASAPGGVGHPPSPPTPPEEGL